MCVCFWLLNSQLSYHSCDSEILFFNDLIRSLVSALQILFLLIIKHALT